MIIHNFDPIFIDLKFFQIRWYSLAYIFGILIGWYIAKKIIQKRYSKFNDPNLINAKDFDNLITYLIIGIIIGGRLGYIIFYNISHYLDNFFEIFMIWKGGMSFHGGLAGIIIASLIFSKKNKINFFSITDVIACVSPIGIFFGRIANFINSELYGKISSVPWAVVFPNNDGVGRHPSQIYEAILEGLILFILINFLALKKNLIIKSGYVSSVFLILYSILRMFSENFREPDQHIGYFFNYFSMGTLLSILTLIIGFLIIFFIKKNEQNN